jgi:hypothetical protein
MFSASEAATYPYVRGIGTHILTFSVPVVSMARYVIVLRRSRSITHSHMEGARDEPERRSKGNSSQSWVENTTRTECISSL